MTRGLVATELFLLFIALVCFIIVIGVDNQLSRWEVLFPVGAWSLATSTLLRPARERLRYGHVASSLGRRLRWTGFTLIVAVAATAVYILVASGE